jgi:hypothetical protein
MRRVAKRFAAWIERRALAQLHAQIAALEASVGALDRRLSSVQVSIDATAARAAVSVEHVQGAAESEARLARRVDAIERLLAAKAPDAT